MARAKNAENLMPVTGNVPVELREAMEEYRWDPKVRKSASEVVREAVEYWAKGTGIWPKDDAESASEDTTDSAGESTDDSASEDTSETGTDEAAPAEDAKADEPTKTRSRNSRSGN